jgi:hypothetical protein
MASAVYDTAPRAEFTVDMLGTIDYSLTLSNLQTT